MIEAEEIRNLFGDLLDEITDPGLRDGVVEAWTLACAEGGWKNLDEVKAMPFTLLTDTGGIGFIAHTLAVTLGAIGLAEAQLVSCETLPYAIDRDRLIAGGLLHDVGKLLEIEPDGSGGYRKSHSGRCTRHPISGTVIAARVGLGPEVLNCIACHAREGEGRPKTVETILIHQADFATFDPLTARAAGILIEE